MEERLTLEAELPVRPFSQNYAILISGKTSKSERANLELAYNVLLEHDFPPSNIYILDYLGKPKQDYSVDSSATRRNISRIFSHLEKRVKPEDYVFTYVTDHGGRDNVEIGGKKVGISSFSLLYSDICDFEFVDFLKKLNVNNMVCLFDQCYGGGFTELMAEEGKLSLSASRPNQPSYGNCFTQNFFKAFGLIDADSNGDGIISLKEAFLYARKEDESRDLGLENPMIRSKYKDPSQITLGTPVIVK